MQKILNVDLLDIIPFKKGFIYAQKEDMPNGVVKVTFFAYDAETNTAAPVTKGVYLLNKFGANYKQISEQLGDYVSCDCTPYPGKMTIVVYPSGEIGLFNNDGSLNWTDDLFYHNAPVSDVVVEDKYIWCTVPEKNSIIRYSPQTKKVELRIGGEKSTTFDCPISLAVVEDTLYVCNKGSFKIRTVNLSNYSVSDYLLFDEPVYKYIASCGYEFVVLESGIYKI